MRPLNLGKWAYGANLEGLMLFAQLADELLFDYTLDSYKLPLLNTKTRCEEALAVVDGIRKGVIRPGNLRPALEELEWSLQTDPIARRLVSEIDFVSELLRQGYRGTSGDMGVDLAGASRVLDYLRQILSKDYLTVAENMLANAVGTPKEKELITVLTKTYIIELTAAGHSRRHIFHRLHQFFFEGPDPERIDSPSQIRQFFQSFSGKPQEWQVTARVSRGFLQIRDAAAVLGVEISNKTPKPRTTSPLELQYLHGPKNNNLPAFATLQVKALDPHGARSATVERLKLISRIRRYHNHRGFLRWAPSMAIYDEQGLYHFIDPSVPPMMVTPIMDEQALPGFVLSTIRLFDSGTGLDSESKYRLYRTLDAHGQAVESATAPPQLLLLWAALEGLLPKAQEDSRISHYSSTLEPVLVFRYAHKLLGNLDLDLRRMISEPYDQVMSGMGDGPSPLYNLAALLALDEFLPLRERIYAATGANVLLRNRFYELRRTFETPESWLSSLSDHSRRVKWHLQRIYRARNSFIHSAEEPELVEVLVENLHSYVDLAAETVFETARRMEHLETLESVFVHLGLRYRSFLRDLEKAKGTRFTRDNIAALILPE